MMFAQTSNIERGLYLLDQTGLPDWQGKLCPESLSSWPEEGNLLNMPEVDHTQDELDPVADHQEREANSEGLNTYGAYHGPSPLQSGEHPDESFEGTLGGVMDPPPHTQSSIMDAEQRLQAMFQSLNNTDTPLSEVPVPEDSHVAQAAVHVSITGDTATVGLL
jgi:hypothetical protein